MGKSLSNLISMKYFRDGTNVWRETHATIRTGNNDDFSNDCHTVTRASCRISASDWVVRKLWTNHYGLRLISR